MMKEAATIVFTEAETSEEAVIIVKYDNATVALALSRKLDGDLQVVMEKEDATKLLDALKTALALSV